MKCAICNHTFIIKRRIKDLFLTKQFYVCDACYKKYPINISYNVLPLNNYSLKIFQLFGANYHLKNDPFLNEFSQLFEYVYKLTDNEILIYNNLKINNYSLATFETLSSLLEHDIFIVCDYCEMP
jgi:hypothetical protein